MRAHLLPHRISRDQVFQQVGKSVLVQASLLPIGLTGTASHHLLESHVMSLIKYYLFFD